MSQFFRKGGIALNDTEWIQDFADRRLQYGVSQTKLAVIPTRRSSDRKSVV